MQWGGLGTFGIETPNHKLGVALLSALAGFAAATASAQGSYVLGLERQGAGSTRLTGITASANTGTPAQEGVASANTGQTITLTDVPAINAELLVVLASDDERVNAGWPAYEAALKAAGKTYALLQPADTLHGFHNDTTPRYDQAAAELSWQRTLAFLRQHLG